MGTIYCNECKKVLTIQEIVCEAQDTVLFDMNVDSHGDLEWLRRDDIMETGEVYYCKVCHRKLDIEIEDLEEAFSFSRTDKPDSSKGGT